MAIQELLDVMAKGLERHATLLGAALPRVSSEGLVVAICAEAFLDESSKTLSITAQPVPFEANIEVRKRDLTVTDAAGTYDLEFKCLWPGGLHENVIGISRDLEKLSEAKLSNGYVVAFAYALKTTPDRSRYRAVGDLSTLVIDATKRINRKPSATSKNVCIAAHGCVADAQLVAWKA